MPDTPKLRRATREELAQSLSFALRFNGRKRVHGADELMAQITAERLIERLERSGYVVMCKPPTDQGGPNPIINSMIRQQERDRGE